MLRNAVIRVLLRVDMGRVMGLGPRIFGLRIFNLILY